MFASRAARGWWFGIVVATGRAREVFRAGARGRAGWRGFGWDLGAVRGVRKRVRWGGAGSWGRARGAFARRRGAHLQPFVRVRGVTLVVGGTLGLHGLSAGETLDGAGEPADEHTGGVGRETRRRARHRGGRSTERHRSRRVWKCDRRVSSASDHPPNEGAGGALHADIKFRLNPIRNRRGAKDSPHPLTGISRCRQHFAAKSSAAGFPALRREPASPVVTPRGDPPGDAHASRLSRRRRRRRAAPLHANVSRAP